MRFFMTIIPPREYIEGTAQPPQSLMDAMGPYMQKAIENGTLISTGGLKSTAQAQCVQARGGRISVVDGPFAESKEMIGGYAVMEAPSKAAALEMATDFVNLHIEHGVPDIELQIREIDGGYNI